MPREAVTNFKATRPLADSDMAAQVFKDLYVFDFLRVVDPRREREIEQALIDLVQLIGLTIKIWANIFVLKTISCMVSTVLTG